MQTHNSLSRPWRIEARDNEAEIYLYSDIGDSVFGDSVTAEQFAQDLRKLGSVGRILLRINSGGGNVFAGVSIYNQLVEHPATIVGQVDGLCASIASVILMSAETIVMNPGTFLMVHNPHTMTAGDSADFLKMSQTLAKVKSSLIDIYRKRSHLSAEKLSELMDNETWFTPQEAIDAGLADEIGETGQAAMPIAASLDLSKYKRVPQQIAARMQRSAPPSPSYCHWDSTSLQELNDAHEQLLLQRRLNDLKYRRDDHV